MEKLRKKLYALKASEKLVFAHGTGKRKCPLQKRMEALEAYLDKLKEYAKEDAMGNGQLKAGYNIRHEVDSEYIVWLL